MARIESALEECEANGDEGLILRHPSMPWEPKRTNNLLKVKRRHDAEAEVIGYTWGRQTDRGSKLLGLMGNMILRMPNGKVFEIAGFTDAERQMSRNMMGSTPFDQDEGIKHPGEKITDAWFNKTFPIRSTITYSYRELTDEGLPKEAQFKRKPVAL
jgi:ATP-dependent DNA ligase